MQAKGNSTELSTFLKYGLSFIFYITQRSFLKVVYIYFIFHWFSGENCIIFLYSLHKERQTSK